MNNAVRLKNLFILFVPSLFLFVFAIFKCGAQNKIENIDTLLKNAQVKYKKDPGLGIKLATSAYMAAEDSTPQVQIKCIYMITYFYWGVQDFSNAGKYAEKGIVVAKEGRIDSLTGDFLVLKGAIDHVGNNYQQAIKSYLNAIPYYNKNGLQKRIGNTYINIGICEMKISNY
ncbi:MAG TPA: hypothetical protein VHZ50_06745, partial [Puia sp.]|nr:hypothetical protein [Puia sp.]